METSAGSSILNLNYTLICKKDGEEVCRFSTKKTRKVLYNIKSLEWDEAYFRIRYIFPVNDVMNDVICQTIEEFQQMFDAFLEPELLNYIESGKWN
jgi:hypothetical protein